MGFASGSVSFRRFAVVGKAEKSVTEEMLEKLNEHALRIAEDGVPEEVEYGWSGGRHIFDGEFSFENNVYAEALHFALRVDSNKVPGSIRKAYQLMEEQAVAATNPSGFISKQQKRDVKDVINRKVDDDMRSGRFRRSRLLSVLWDVPAGVLYCSATGATFEKLAEIFERTFGLTLNPLTSGSLGLAELEAMGHRRDYEDLRPTRFVPSPGGSDGEYPEYPWIAKGPEPKDFLGNEFLLWLWHEADGRNGVIDIGSGHGATIFIDRSLDLDCAYGQTGRDMLRGDGPSRMPEARDALRSGKVPRKAGMILDVAGMQFNLTLSAEALAVGGAKLPEVEEADTARVLFEERIAMLRELGKSLDGMYAAFLKVRASSSWEGYVTSVRRWIQSTKNSAAA